MGSTRLPAGAVKGAIELKVEFSTEVVSAAIEASFSSIGVFQELLKGICQQAGITATQSQVIPLTQQDYLARAVEIKANEYAARHQRALEAIAAGHTNGGAKGDLPPLYLPYYLVRVVLEGGFDGIGKGMHRTDLHERIRAVHHRGGDVRASHISNLLGGLANLQAAKSISPPIIDYDSQNRLLQVVDSTFYFFIKHADIADILESLQNPLKSYAISNACELPASFYALGVRKEVPLYCSGSRLRHPASIRTSYEGWSHRGRLRSFSTLAFRLLG